MKTPQATYTMNTQKGHKALKVR